MKREWLQARFGVCLLFLIASSTSFAGQPLPDKTGVSGFINLGLGASSVETNMFAESSLNDLGEARVDNLDDSPGSESFGIPVIFFELAYTWADSKTKVFLGSEAEDALRFDFFVDIGVRQGTENVGVFGLDAISTPGGLKTWSDPYAINIDRDSTETTARGFRASWDGVVGSGLEIRYSTSDVEIDDEMSGTALGLTTAERDSLGREGDVNRFDAAYEYRLSEQIQFTPRLSWIERNLDGEAMARDGMQLDLSYMIRGQYIYVVNFLLGSFNYDETNPIYGHKNEADRAGVSLTVLWKDVFGLKDWSGNVG